VQLLSIRENEVQVELEWGDALLLAHLCRRAQANDALGDAPNWPAVNGHAEALAAFFEAAGLASYATFALGQPEPAEAEEYSLEAFRTLYPLTGQYAAWQARQRQRGETPTESDDEKGGA
jgi:hypothetical protein